MINANIHEYIQENGVYFRFTSPIDDASKTKEFHYKVKYFSTGKIIKRPIWIIGNKKDLIKLIDYWNKHTNDHHYYI